MSTGPMVQNSDEIVRKGIQSITSSVEGYTIIPKENVFPFFGSRSIPKIQFDCCNIGHHGQRHSARYELASCSSCQDQLSSAAVRRVVKELHAGGFVHGDVGATNILVDRESLAKEADDVNVISLI